MKEEGDNRNPITPFAVTDYRDVRQIFGIKRRDRSGHMYVVGKTGTGKTTLLENLLYTDIRRGEGLALIDPHGDLAEEVLHFVPEDRIEEVIYFNPADTEYPLAFNPLAATPPALRHLVASGLVSVFKKTWPEFWGPRLEYVLRNSLLTLLESPDATLLDLPKLLTDKAFRMKLVERVSDEHLRAFWLLEFNKFPPRQQLETISPVLNKTGQFLTDLPLRYMIGQSRNSFTFRKAMDEGKVVIANLSKGRIGEDTCLLFGSLLVNRIMLAALSRATLAEERRRPFYLYVDEVHNFLTPAFADILSESRKYGLNLILAHQYTGQLDERIRSAVFGNVGTLVSFRVGVEDARVLAREYAPVFDASDLIGLPNYHIYLKLLIDGLTSRPFSAVTLPPPPIDASHKAEIIEFSRAKYGRPRREVAQEIHDRSARSVVDDG